jgi:hypothetical protein
MKSQITSIVLQCNHDQTKNTVFTTYNYPLVGEYDGFNTYSTFNDAENAVKKLINTNNDDFISSVTKYKLIKFDKDGNKTTQFIKPELNPDSDIESVLRQLISQINQYKYDGITTRYREAYNDGVDMAIGEIDTLLKQLSQR